MERALTDESEIARRAFASFSERFPYMLVLLNPTLEIEWATDSSRRLLGHDPEALVGRPVGDFVHVDDFTKILPLALESAGSAEEILENEAAAIRTELLVRIRTASDQWLPMSVTARVFDGDGRLLCAMRPAPDRMAMDQVFHQLGHGAELDQTLESVLALARAQFGVENAWFVHDFDSVASVVGDADPRLPDPASLLGKLRAAGPHGSVEFDEVLWVVPVHSASGSSVQGALVLPASRPGGPTPYDIYVLDRARSVAAVALARADSDRVLHRRANTDHLTGVLNRRALELELDSLSGIAENTQVSVIFVDLDGFKVVNDEYGHSVGDQMLMAVAGRISNAVRASDAIARFGGDEFAVICRNLPEDEVEPTRQRIENVLGRPLRIGPESVAISASVGIASASTRAELQDLIRRSDADMYRRKRERLAGED